MNEMIKVATPLVDDRELEALREVLFSGRYASGLKVAAFEAAFAEYCGSRFGVATSTGTSALQIAMASLGIGPGDEVIVPALTFFSTATSVIHQNAIPIFADIDPKSFNLCPADFEKRITERTRAVIPVHFYGQPADMTAINGVAKKHDLFVIEDCAQAHGATIDGHKVGSLARAGCFSFFATKNMTTGEGGIITTDDEALATLARKIRSHGMSDRDTHEILGYNHRMTEFAGALGLVQLDKLDGYNQKRRENSLEIYKRIEDLPWVKIPKIPDNFEHVFFWCPIFIDEEKAGMTAAELRQRLLDNGVETRFRYRQPLNMQKMLLEQAAYPKGCPFTCPYYGQKTDYAEGRYPNAEKVAGRVLGLPNHPGLTPEDLDRVVEVMHHVV